MKIVCPKCHTAYRVDLPDSGGADTEVQCGQCLHIFLFTQDTEEPDSLEIQSGQTWDSDSPDQPLQSEQTSSSPETNREASKEWKPKPLPDDPESMEIVAEDEAPADSLEKEALDDIWNQAVIEGARSKAEVEETPPEKKSQPLPTLDERQQEIDQIIKDHRAGLEELEGGESSRPQKEEKTQEDIDLEEQVTINEEEAIPSWEDAFAHQAEVEAGWSKAQEQDRIQEDRQLAEALGEKADSTQQESGTQEDKQILADEVFAEAKDSQESTKGAAKTPQPESEVDSKQSEVDQMFAEAKAQQEKIQEEIDLNEEVVINEDDDMPSWKDAFAHQTKVEEGWKKAEEQDRIQEEQQLAEALGDKYVPPEPAIDEPPVVAENPQALVDDIFAQMKSQAQSTDQPPAQETPSPFTADIGTSSEKASESTWTDASDDPSKVEDSSDAPPSPEEKEIASPPIASDTDLTANRVDMNMKQLVEEAFKEESEQSEEEPRAEEVESPALEELTLEEEPEYTQEISAEEEIEPPMSEEVLLEDEALEPELSLEAGSVQETLADEQTLPESQDEEDIEQTIDYYASYLDAPGTPEEEEPEEMDSIPELTLESADEETAQEPEETVAQEVALEKEHETIWVDAFDGPSEIEDTEEIQQEVEPSLEIVESSAEAEIEITEPVPVESEQELTAETQETAALSEEPLEIEPEPVMETEQELTAETQETAALSEEQPTMPQESSFDEEGEALWEDLLTEHKEEGQLADEEISVDSVEEEEPFGGNDFWDQVLEKDSQEPPTAESGEEQPLASAPVTQDTTEREAMTDEELWQQAFPGEEELAPAAQLAGEEENLQSEVTPLVIEADVNLKEEPEDSLKYDEAAYADYDDDEDEFEFQRKKRNLGPFTIPHGRRGDMVIGGVMVVFLLLAGSIYFTLQTFAPGELTDIETAKTEIPEGLSPREVPLDELAGDLTSPKPPTPEKTPAVETPGEKGEAILTDPEKILEEAPEEKGILKDLAESQILKDTGKSQTAKIDQSSLQALTAHSVTMNTIMPVAYNPTDIRVLSFSLEMQLSNAQSANLMRESLPVYEEIVNQTVENFLRRKFYNDILYVKEKLQKRLQTAMNKSLKTGRVRKAKFVDFAIQ